MKRRTWVSIVGIAVTIWFVFFLHSCTAPPPYRDLYSVGEIHRPPSVQVGISVFLRTESARFAVHGPCLLQGERMEDLPAGEVRLRDGRIEIAGRSYEGGEIYVKPVEDATLEVGSRRYHGALIVKRDRDRITLVNEVDLESYLKGVAGKEMRTSAHPEALKAQIIAARSYAMYEARNQTLRRIKGEKFDLYDDQRSQVYGGLERETSAISRLVEETSGMFLLWEDRVLKAFYSSTCGGHTEPAWLILREGEKIPPLGGTPCGFCAGSDYFTWEVTISKSEIARKLFPNEPQARVSKIRISKRLPGGHASEIGITVENQSRERFVEANGGFRLAIGSQRLRSTLWEDPVDRGGDIQIRGHGFGHGAGMCQVGAYRMAESGRSGIQILEYYFPGAKVKKLY